MNLWNAPQPGQTSQWAFSDAAVGLPGGANQVWDISSASLSFDYEVVFVDAATAPGAANFPSATVAMASPGESVHVFFAGDAGGLQLLGNFDADDGTGIRYTDQWRWLLYPTAYGTAWSDTVVAQPIGPGTPDTSIYTLVADGYGTLILPSGTATGVLRTRMQTIDSGVFNGVAWWDSTTYEIYWKPGFPLYLAYGYTNRYQSGTDPVELNTDGEVLVDISIGMDELLGTGVGLQVLQDEAQQELAVLLVADGSCIVQLVDAKGRVIGTEHTNGNGMQRARFSMVGLAPGPYVLHATNGREHGARTVVLAR